VIGHHAHVVQPVRKIGATYVVFGLGNELSNQSEPPRRDGLTVVAIAGPSFGRWRFTGLEIVPTWVDLAGHRVLPVVRTLADPATPQGLADELRASYDRTVATVTSGGAPGLDVPAIGG
jgi:poly-gamma-glutamate synthesis protein (capsule biosynthesis protein)